jgi:hypothetical protein
MYEMKRLPLGEKNAGEASTRSNKRPMPPHPCIDGSTVLQVTYPPLVGQEAIPGFRLLRENNSYEFPSREESGGNHHVIILLVKQDATTMKVVGHAQRPCVLLYLYAIKAYLDAPLIVGHAQRPCVLLYLYAIKAYPPPSERYRTKPSHRSSYRNDYCGNHFDANNATHLIKKSSSSP